MKKYIIILLILLSSCAGRKVNKSEIKEDIKTETVTTSVDTSKIVTTTTENTKIINNSENEVIEIIPVDNKLPIVLNGKKYFNVKIRRYKSKDDISVIKDKKVLKTEDKAVKIVSKNKKLETKTAKVKEIDKEAVSFWNYLWFFFWILIIIFVILFIKNKINIL
jgi:hypothetical protein